jgi:hypothetical protein
MSWIGESTRSRTMPDCSDCMTTAPRTAPGIVPMPPANEVPPMTAAAMTYSSLCVPRLTVAAFRRADSTTPPTAARMPMITNVIMIVRLVLIPARFAASGLPPIENT